MDMANERKADLRERMFEFACDVVQFSRRLSKEPGVVRQIAWQLADAATSAGANIEEAKSAYSRRDSAAKNSISLKEMRESLYWLKVICRCGLAPAVEVQPLLDEASELTAMLTAGMKRLRPVLLALLVVAFAVLFSELEFQDLSLSSEL
jgi:four helix bundle protein